MSKDIIYRDDAIEVVEELNAINFYELNEHSKEAFVEIRRALKALPSADRLPQGEWIIEIDTNGNTYGICSICGMKQYAGQLNFCPNCGSDMRESN